MCLLPYSMIATTSSKTLEASPPIDRTFNISRFQGLEEEDVDEEGSSSFQVGEYVNI